MKRAGALGMLAAALALLPDYAKAQQVSFTDERIKASYVSYRSVQPAAGENDPRIDEMWPAYQKALKAAGVRYEMHTYPGTQHGFHNDSTPRYKEGAAKLAWERTLVHFRKHLA